MMNGFKDGMNAGGWVVMSVFWVALIAAIVWAVAALSTRTGGTDAAASGLAERPEEALDRRLASGEIDVNTYDMLRGKLREARAGRV
jgi:putative membrane protein